MADVPILSGEAIVDTALAIVNGEPLHYREWFNQLHRAGYAVAGKEPLAVMCSALHRHPLVESLGDGTFRRDPDAVDDLRKRVTVLRRLVVEHIDSPEQRDPAITELQRAERTLARVSDG